MKTLLLEFGNDIFTGLKMDIATSKSLHFEASEDIITKFKLQGLYIIRIKYWNASGSGFPPSLIPALRNIVILLHKQATRIKHFCPECTPARLNLLQVLHLNRSLIRFQIMCRIWGIPHWDVEWFKPHFHGAQKSLCVAFYFAFMLRSVFLCIINRPTWLDWLEHFIELAIHPTLSSIR